MEALKEAHSSQTLPPIPTAAPDIIEAHLRGAILQGTLQPGTPIRQQALADQFSVSRMPVREALRKLEAQGFVVGALNKGYFVSTKGASAGIETVLRPLSEQYAQLPNDQERLAFESAILRLIRSEPQPATFA